MISQTAEYALRAVVFLANRQSLPSTTAEISRHTRVPAGYLAKVMQSLGRADLVHSQRGLQGGFTLAGDPAQLTVLQVISAVDPPRRIKTCPLGLPTHENLCPLHSRLDQAIAQVEDVFGRTTIGELIDPPRPHGRSCRFPGLPLPATRSKSKAGRATGNGQKGPGKRSVVLPVQEKRR